MNQTNKTIIIIIIAIALSIGLLSFLDKKNSSSEKYDEFATCLSEKGTKFYGAFWCTHCQNQKKMFENSKKLPYIECSTPDGNNQTQECNDAEVKSYPTWIFEDGSRLSGEISLETLAEKTSCILPVNSN